MIVQAGFARADITPRTPTPLSGFASRTELATGTLDPLEVRTLVLRDNDKSVAVVAVDIIGVPDTMTDDVRAALGPGGPDVIIAATHTHAGPPVLSRAMLGKPATGYSEHLVAMTVRAIKSAQRDLRPAVISRRSAATSGIAHNRRQSDGPVEHEADVILLKRQGAASIVWVNFACHPVVLGPDNLCYSADFPGVTRSAIEAATGAATLYTTGCAGNINLGHSAEDSIRKTGLEKRSSAEASRIGRSLADACIAALSRPGNASTTAPLEVASAALSPQFIAPDAEKRAALLQSARARLADASLTAGERMMANIDLAWLAAPEAFVPDLPVSTLRCGPVDAVFLPGEIFVETALAIKAERPGALVVGYTGMNPGYIPPRDATGGYEVEVAWRPYGAPGPFMPGTAEELAALALSL